MRFAQVMVVILQHVEIVLSIKRCLIELSELLTGINIGGFGQLLIMSLAAASFVHFDRFEE